MITFVHTADWHLDFHYTYGGYERLNEIVEKANSIVNFAVEEECSFVLICGDIFNRPRPDERVREAFISTLKPLMEVGIPTVIIPGQHDKISDQVHAHLSMRAFVKSLGKRAPNIRFIDKLTRMTIVSGVNLVVQPWMRFIDPEPWSRMVKEDHINILMGHFPVFGALMSEEGFECGDGISPEEFEPFDYVALGDFHNGDQPNYSGSIARFSFAERKKGKGFKFVKIKDQGDVKVKFIELEDRPFSETAVVWAEDEDIDAQTINDMILLSIEMLAPEQREGGFIKVKTYVPQDVSSAIDEAGIRRTAIKKYGCVDVNVEWELIRKEYAFSRLESLEKLESSDILSMSSRNLLQRFVRERWKGKGAKKVYEEGKELLDASGVVRDS